MLQVSCGFRCFSIRHRRQHPLRHQDRGSQDLRRWCDSDIISEIRDASEYLDSSHFAHDVADILKKHIVASIAKYSKNSTEADIYEHWDRDVNAYVQDADSIFVRMDSAISFRTKTGYARLNVRPLRSCCCNLIT